MSTSKVTSLAGSFGRLWGRGHESFGPHLRRILSVSGKGATTYLQGLVTSDLLTPPTPPRIEPEGDQPGVPKSIQKQERPPVEFSDKLRATCFLDNKGRIVTDSLLWKVDDHQYFIDCPGTTADELMSHLKLYKLRRSKVDIEDKTMEMASHVVFGTLNAAGAPPGYLSAVDPRHPSLGMRILRLPDENTTSSLEEKHADFANLMAGAFPDSPGNYELVRRLAGVAEGAEIQGKVALESNQEHLNAVSFHKGCYLGQELTARVHHTGVLRKRILPLLLLDTRAEVPHAWSVASSLQDGRAQKRFTKAELKKLPSRLPRLSVLTIGNLVAITTGAVEPEGEAVDDEARQELAMVQQKAEALLNEIEGSCKLGAKIVDGKDGKTVGQIVSEPVKGTNVVLALMRLESVGLLAGGTWSKVNKIKIGDSENELRYLPYLPLWWPELDPQTGKAKEEEDEEGDDEEEDPEARDEDAVAEISGFKMPRIQIEELPLNESESKRP